MTSLRLPACAPPPGTCRGADRLTPAVCPPPGRRPGGRGFAGNRPVAEGGLVGAGMGGFADRVPLIREEAFEMADANEICRMDAVTLAGRIKAKELSPVEVVDGRSTLKWIWI